MTIIFYLIIIGAIIFLVKKYGSQINQAVNPGHANLQSTQSQNTDVAFKALADDLGFKLTIKEKSTDPKVIQQGGYELTGEYRDYPAKIVYAWETKELPTGLTHGYEYFIDSRVELKTNLNGEWVIQAKGKAGAGTSTGHEGFDSKFTIIGDASQLTSQQLEIISQYDWIHLQLKNGILILIDDYADWLKNTSGAQAMMGAVHPLWKTPLTNQELKANEIKVLLEKLIAFSKTN